tara:strand:+ start:566 stop:802 length:237 start_codon:yes stop_codon:yes gene_type:complete
MTRKDFQLIADVVATIDDVNTRNELALNFVTKLYDTNERFDSVRFLKACQVNIKKSSDKPKKDDRFDDSYAKESFIAP